MSRLPPEIQRLLLAPFDSLEKLEICVALWRAPARTSSPGELTRRILLPADVIDHALEELVAAHAVELAGGLARLVPPESTQALVEIYEADRLLVIRVLSELAMDRIRGMAARTFADAFNLRKKPPGGDDG
jgi:hypothetical protein